MSVDEWDEMEGKGFVALKRVDATAVYVNQDDNVVIRQQNALGEDDDFIVVPKHLVPALVLALNKAIGDA